jgi:hypothetical protein
MSLGDTSSHDVLLELFAQVVVKITVELLSILALVSKQIEEGRFSTCNVTYLSRHSVYTGKFTGRLLGESDHQPKIGSIGSGGGSGDCCTDLECRPLFCGKCEGSMEAWKRRNGYTIVFEYVSEHRSGPLLGKASAEGIRQNLGICLEPRTRLISTALTRVRTCSSSSVKRNLRNENVVSPSYVVAKSDDILQVDNCDSTLALPDLSTNQNYVRKARRKEPQYSSLKVVRQLLGIERSVLVDSVVENVQYVFEPQKCLCVSQL